VGRPCAVGACTDCALPQVYNVSYAMLVLCTEAPCCPALSRCLHSQYIVAGKGHAPNHACRRCGAIKPAM